MTVTEKNPSCLGDSSTRSGKRTKIALFGIFGIQNIGNEYTLEAMLYNVRLRVPDAEVYGVCYEPEDTQRLHKLPAVRVKCAKLSRHVPPARNAFIRLFRGVFRRIPLELYDWFRVVWALRATDLMIMTGTGMLTDYLCGSFVFPYDVFKWSLAGKLARCKVRFVGVGVSPIYGRLSRVFVKAALGLADYRGFRDEQSRNRLKHYGFERANDAVFPDLVFSLPRSALPASNHYPGAKPVVGLGVMKFVDAHNGTDYDAVYDRYIETMCDFTTWLLEHGYGVRVLEGDMRHDPPVRADLEARLSRRGVAYGVADISAPAIASPEDLVEQISRVDFVVSPRFHNLVFGIMLGKPVVSLSYDPKNDALLKACGLGEYCQSIENVDLNRLIAQFIDLESKAPRLRVEIQRKADEYCYLLHEQYSQVLGEFGPNSVAARQRVGGHVSTVTDNSIGGISGKK
jgi:polysaccharide pyruvyl transferase WcaK-like protein